VYAAHFKNKLYGEVRASGAKRREANSLRHTFNIFSTLLKTNAMATRGAEAGGIIFR